MNYPNNRPIKPASNLSALKVVGIVVVSIVLLFLILFYTFLHSMFKSANEYEKSFYTLKGVFETTDSIRAPISGKMTNVVKFDVTWNTWSVGSDNDYRTNFTFLHFKPGTTMNVNGKKLKIVGDQVHDIRDKKDYRTIAHLWLTTKVQHEPDTVPDAINGLDIRLDDYIRQYKSGHLFMGSNARLTLGEQCYSTTDTVTIRAHVRNDTIFLEQSKY